MSRIRTNTLSIGNLGEISKTGNLWGEVHEGSGWYCNSSDCLKGNGVLVATCNPSFASSLNERCACLSKNAPCPKMQSGSSTGGLSTGTIDSIQITPEKVDTSRNCPANSPNPSWPYALANNNQVPVISCLYPEDAIPTDEQAQKMAENLNDADNRRFLANYCFSPEPNSINCPAPLTSCPRAISKSAICNQFGEANKKLYDQRAVDYCLDIYNKNKGNPQFNIASTGCKCIKDQKINPDPGLGAILTTIGLGGGGAHCIWGPCVPTSPNLNTYSDRDTACPTVSCLNLINVGGAASVDKSQFIQNLNCGSQSKCSCQPGQVCDEKTATCSGTPTPQPPAPEESFSKYLIPLIILCVMLILSSIGIGIWFYKK
ncbi:MAG: hypothetical protein Harvfovirus77_3 [Harvfovirus sp.]|uniref:Uncharacterized protein n=1 Tax=Harvfovirus sp. TaxID=2487768 RepID=A0A3G5A6P5_9VIRU|nr:MAG: hypothetical protein Harvfovirus77_3 [Harvfovirus sp.]